MNIRIRAALVSDVECIFNIRCAVRENHLSRHQLAHRGITMESIQEMISGGDYISPIAEVNEMAVGFGMAQISASYVFALFVLPEYERRGIGKALLRSMEHGLVQNGVEEAWLSTSPKESIRALGFYRHLGWIESGFLDDGEIRLCKRLVK